MRTQTSKASTVALLARAIGVALVLGAAAVACGSDDDATTAGALDENHQQVFDVTLQLAEDNGFDFDEECVRDIVSQLSDEDAELIASSPPDENPELSDEGEALGDSLESCAIAATNSSLVEEAAAKAIANEDNLEPDCVHENFAKLSDEQLQLWIDSEPDSTDPQLIAVGFSILDCISFDDPVTTSSG